MTKTTLLLTSSKGPSTRVKFTNIIGRNQVASFFASNGWAMTDAELKGIFDMKANDVRLFNFPNGTDWIVVERSLNVR